jgi:hypothetical protein
MSIENAVHYCSVEHRMEINRINCIHCGGTGLAETELYEGIVNCPHCMLEFNDNPPFIVGHVAPYFNYVKIAPDTPYNGGHDFGLPITKKENND